MDDSDHAIVQLLREDGRMTLTNIAKSVGLSPDAIRARISRMTSDGVLRVMGLVAPEALGYNAIGSLVMQYRGPIDEIVRSLRTNPNVTFVAQLIGDMNIFCALAARDDRELAHVVNTLLADNPRIHNVDVARQLGLVKWFSHIPNDHSPSAYSSRGARGLHELDELDERLLRKLVGNPRASYRDLADAVGEPYWVVRSRVRRLFDVGHVRATAAIDRVSTVPDMQALIRINLSGDLDDGLAEIASIPEIRLLVLNSGSTSLLSGEVACSDGQHLAALIGRLLAIGRVESVRTYIYAHIHVLATPWRFDVNYRGEPLLAPDVSTESPRSSRSTMSS